jgi:hypothetical protein
MRNKNAHEVSVNTILPVRREGDKKSQTAYQNFPSYRLPGLNFL